MSQLDPVQLAALDFARDKPGAGFNLEQGLGKTITALAEFTWYVMHGKCDRMIVICPYTFKQGWVDEVEKHNFQLDTHVFETSKRKLATEFVSRPHVLPPVMIVNYEAARLSSVLRGLTMWMQRGKTYLVIDESIQIKGFKAAQTKAVHKLAYHATFSRILSGRMQTQGPHDLWGQLRAIGLFLDRNYFAFRGRYCWMGGYMNKQVIQAKNPEELAAIMAPYVFVAKKKDWLPELPRKDPTIRDYKMSEEQQRQYNQMEHQFLLELERGVITVQVAIAKYEKLAQIQTGFIYDEQGNAHELVAPSANPRLNLLLQLLEEEVTGKVCVVYRHKPVFNILLKALSQYDCAWITSEIKMKPQDISDQKDRFNNDPHCRVILLQAEKSRYGHTLLGGPGEEDRCRTMIFFENSYSADTRDQIEDRIHRRGQTGEAVLYIDLSGSDLDRRITRALQRKDALYRSVFKNLKSAEPVAA